MEQIKVLSVNLHEGTKFRALAKVEYGGFVFSLRILQQFPHYRPYVDWPGGTYEGPGGKEYYSVIDLPKVIKDQISAAVLVEYHKVLEGRMGI